MPVLSLEISGNDELTREKYSEISKNIFEQKILVNYGNRLKNLLTEMGPRGIPFITGRETLNTLAEDFLNSGNFVKTIASDFSSKIPEDYQHAQKQAIVEWEIFRENKDELVGHINKLIMSIGVAN